MPFAAVVADANVLLSAAIGKAAQRVFTEYEIEIHVTEFNLGEVEKYLPRLASKYGLLDEEIYLHWRVLHMIVHPEADYASWLEKARADLADRDPDDAHPLALARMLEMPLWSNDRDLQDVGVDCFGTSDLLTLLGSGRRERDETPRGEE